MDSDQGYGADQRDSGRDGTDCRMPRDSSHHQVPKTEHSSLLSRTLIFILPYDVGHPLDAVSTVIHELEHLKMNNCGNDGPEERIPWQPLQRRILTSMEHLLPRGIWQSKIGSPDEWDLRHVLMCMLIYRELGHLGFQVDVKNMDLTEALMFLLTVWLESSPGNQWWKNVQS